MAKEHYRQLYQNDLEAEAEWLRRGAAEKVNSIEHLLKRFDIQPVTLLELGCGVGAVIQECQRRDLAKLYTGVDYSEEAIGYLLAHSSGIEAIVADVTTIENVRLKGTFDVVILSHVLEHLQTPHEFLLHIQQNINFQYLIIEVPLEDLFITHLRSQGRDRTQNRAGHIQFFTLQTFRLLLRGGELEIIATHLYVPILDLETIRFVARRDHLSKVGYAKKLLSQRYLPQLLKPLWIRLYYSHYAVLCCRKNTNRESNFAGFTK